MMSTTPAPGVTPLFARPARARKPRQKPGISIDLFCGGGELERLQGFPDGYTLIPGQMRKAVEDDYAAWFAARYPHATREEIERFAKDGPRAKALGNSMATTCMAWIGRRILTIDALIPPEPRDLLAAK